MPEATQCSVHSWWLIMQVELHSMTTQTAAPIWCLQRRTLEPVDGGQDVLEVGVAQVRHHLRLRLGHARRQPAMPTKAVKHCLPPHTSNTSSCCNSEHWHSNQREAAVMTWG
jgi:hypothetical protein